MSSVSICHSFFSAHKSTTVPRGFKICCILGRYKDVDMVNKKIPGAFWFAGGEVVDKEVRTSVAIAGFSNY